MVRKKVSVINPNGIDAQSSALLVRKAGTFECDFFISLHGYRVNGKSILGIMTLAIQQGSEIELEFNGKDEKKALESISTFFQKDNSDP